MKANSNNRFSFQAIGTDQLTTVNGGWKAPPGTLGKIDGFVGGLVGGLVGPIGRAAGSAAGTWFGNAQQKAIEDAVAHGSNPTKTKFGFGR